MMKSVFPFLRCSTAERRGPNCWIVMLYQTSIRSESMRGCPLCVWAEGGMGAVCIDPKWTATYRREPTSLQFALPPPPPPPRPLCCPWAAAYCMRTVMTPVTARCNRGFVFPIGITPANAEVMQHRRDVLKCKERSVWCSLSFCLLLLSVLGQDILSFAMWPSTSWMQ
jgi:hypothetical protein